MIYWFTGQPGHGKTLLAIERALEFKAQGRRVFVCNVKDFEYGKTGCEPMTPEQFREWMTFLPDGAVALVDEAYEHDMLPKRPPSAKVPAHVEQLAKHRHRGIDFIFVCQSPDKQCDVFTHDLIERHIHVRRRFGTWFVHLREFDRYERNPEKANPLVLRRGFLPKSVFGLYKSTELDTTERKIPWYFIAAPVGALLALGLMYYTFGNMGERLGGSDEKQVQARERTEPSGEGRDKRAMTALEYIEQLQPRIPSQPWSAPAYDDKLQLSSEPPRIFCALSGEGIDANGEFMRSSCTCLTEQGTRYHLDISACRVIAMNGQYEPFYDERTSTRGDGYRIQEQSREAQRRNQLGQSGEGWNPSAMPRSGDSSSIGTQSPEQVASYGGFRGG